MEVRTYRIVSVVNGHVVMKDTDFEKIKARMIKLYNGYEKRYGWIFGYVIDVDIYDDETDSYDADVLDWFKVFDKVIFTDDGFKFKNPCPTPFEEDEDGWVNEHGEVFYEDDNE